MKEVRISGYFDTKFMTVPGIEQILHNFTNFLTLHRSIFA